MDLSRSKLAAHNNADWCQSVCQAHGVPGEFLPTVWINRGIPPPYHPNLIVISPAGDPEKMGEYIRELVGLRLPPKWSIKDSFSTLKLEELGFDLLFEASWIWRDPGPVDPRGSSSGIRWYRIVSPEQLLEWEAAWSGNPRNSDTTGRPVQFPASMLKDRKTVFFSGGLGQAIHAGGIANFSENVVGLSNIFVNAGDPRDAWIGLVDQLQAAFPGLPLVGYERNPELESALACGFKPVGNLRVWTHNG
jgi:hypothetical protein